MREWLACRVAGEDRRENTFVKITDTPYDHPRLSRSISLRGKLLLAPEGAPEVRSLLTLSYTDSYGPQAALIARPFDALEYGYESSPRFRTRASVAISDTSWEV